MKFNSLFFSLVASLSAHLVCAISVQVNVTTKGIDNPNGQNKLIAADLYTLNTYSGLHATALQLVQDQAVPADAVECRGYKDSDGNLPGSLPFSGDTTALLATNTVAVGSIVCYGIGVLSTTA